MTVFTISANLDKLQSLPASDDYLLHNYKWIAPSPDIPNRVQIQFDTIEEAMAVHHELRKLHIFPLFRNWM